ncbi:unnamed protein product [Cuscuta epithymum]|uniref:Uncharacterized protein n=1 Tax=Cuscuta epithymum TaxID=186058 RepID=A0AAV0EVG6_9ASTE|nr:unnamed protein product [Cuscuta epithymum]
MIRSSTKKRKKELSCSADVVRHGDTSALGGAGGSIEKTWQRNGCGGMCRCVLLSPLPTFFLFSSSSSTYLLSSSRSGNFFSWADLGVCWPLLSNELFKLFNFLLFSI